MLLAPLAIGTATAATAPQSAVALAYPAWAPNTYYAVGARVTYSGKDYEIVQPHTSLAGWEPPNVPALWKLLPGGSTPSPSATPTKPPTSPSPSATPTKPPTSPSPSPSATPTKPPTSPSP
ncbi:carbohydrate-binding protein, partial [Sphaerimonospora thailandensis]|uniref:carbohydrate-binding protein n=1 Tax=Sphaerimonospora thailandensis TaxID=795644 RepID=UPI00389ACC46